MATITTVRLNKGDSANWGFRLQGGKDFGTPLVIQKVNGGSPAERAGLIAGDAVIKINNVDVYNLLHKEAQDVIVRAGFSFEMVIQRGGSTWKPSVVPTGTYAKPSPSINNVNAVTQTSLAATKGENIGAIGTGHNLSAKPFGPQVNGAVNGGPKLVNKQYYNTPVKLYSEDLIAETISAQSEVLSTGALGVNFKKNEKNYDSTNSAVYRMLQEAENDSGNPNEQEPDSGIVTAPNKGVAGLRHVVAPHTKPAPANPQLPPGQNICAECERLIVGVFVRIKEKNLHVECFKCSTCGSSLKNVGYYNINNKLYCDVHAKSAAIAVNNSTAVPITVSTGGIAPVSAISAALSSHSLPSPSQLSPKTPSFAPSYQPAEEENEAHPVSDDLSSAPIAPLPNLNSTPSYESNIKPSSNSSIINTSAPLSFSKYINKSSNIGGPKPFSSVSAPLSPGGTLPRAAPLSPQTNFNKAPLSPSAPSYGSYSPSSNTGRSTNITWPPPQEDTDIPTACPLFYAPPSRVEAELEKQLAAKKQTKFESEYFADEEDINIDETMSYYSEELCYADRRSATECVDILTETLDTQKLIENVIKSSPNIEAPPLTSGNQKFGEPESLSRTACSLSLPDDNCCQNTNSCELQRPVQYTSNTTECQLPIKVENSIPQKWESPLTQAVRTTAPDSDTFSLMRSRTPASPMVSALAIAPAQPFNPIPHSVLDHVPLPEETEPYFPPEHPIIPKQIEDEKKQEERLPIPKPYSPFVKALEIAPDRPFTPVGGPAPLPPVKKKPKDALDKLIDELPKPYEPLDMRSALTTAPERPYTPVVSEHEQRSSEDQVKQLKLQGVDRSQLIKPLRPDELPASFQMNKKVEKPPSYYSPAVLEQRIQSETQESIEATENREITIVEKETIQSAQLSQQVVDAPQELQPQSTNFAPLFQGFSCSFKNKTDHSQFSIDICTTPPVPTPPPKPQTPISYIATVEERPAYVTKEKIIQESTGVQQTTKRQHQMSHEVKEQRMENQLIQRQAEEVVQVKPLPVTTMLRKAEALPSYQKDLQATAEADLLLMERKRRAEERLEQQKREREQQKGQQNTQVNIQESAQYAVQEQREQHNLHQSNQKSAQYGAQQQTIQNSPPNQPQTFKKPPPPSAIKPIIKIETENTNNVAPKINFQPVLDDKPGSTTFSPRPRSITPSMINKAPPLLPYYQDNLVPHFHAAIETNVFDPTHPETSRSPSPYPGQEAHTRSPSPFPAINRKERSKSPAPGPPVNPLQSSKPLPTPQDSKIHQASENLKSYLPDYKSQRDVVEQQRGMDFCKKDADYQETDFSQVSQNVAYPMIGQTDNRFAVQTGNVQQQVHQLLQVADSQKHQSQVSQTNDVITKKNIAEKSHQENLAASSQTQSHSTEMSADGLTQVQRRKVVTEEYERSHKESNIQIETNKTSVHKNNFSKVNVPAIDTSNVQPFHVTNPHHNSSSFKTKEVLASQTAAQILDTHKTLQQASNKLTDVCQRQPIQPVSQGQPQLVSLPGSQPQSIPPQPPVRRVFPPGSLAPIKHVIPPSACQKPSDNVNKPNVPEPDLGAGTGRQTAGITAAPKRGRGMLNTAVLPGARVPLCGGCHGQIRGPFITALGKIWCPQHFVCATPSCRRPLQDLGFVEEQGQLYCEYCFEQYLAPPCSKCNGKIKGDCLKAIGKNFHPECFNCVYCGKLFANNPFFLEDGNPYCDADWNELFTTKCFACGFPVEAGDRWVEALSNNYHSQCFNCTMCKKNLEGQSFFAKGGRPFCKNHAR